MMGTSLLRAENLAAPNFRNTISKPPTKDMELAHVIFHSLLCYHQKDSDPFSTTFLNP